MSEEAFLQRTVTCGQLSAADEGRTVVLNGWVHRDRNHGALHFINLRDRYGITQVVVDDDASGALQETASQLKLEYCIAVRGIVRRRPQDMVNHDMATGEIEVKAEHIEILSRCDVLPFMIEDENNAKEDLRLKYRYLDLRGRGMTDRIVLRHRIVKAIREYFYRTDFLEIETPTLIRSTPEGARDFLVPSRIYPGKFFALPQSPQLYKQLLMVSGMDKYFQIARCYRDEDPRGDRQLEFTQLDIEMSYVQRDDVLALVEDLFNDVFRKVLDVELPRHFRRLTYHDAMNTYGSDKPDLRFAEALSAGGAVKYLVAPASDRQEFTRKYITSLEDAAKVYGAHGLAWMKVQDGTLSGGVSKFFADKAGEIIEATGAHDGDMILIVAHENWKKCQEQARCGPRSDPGRLRLLLDHRLPPVRVQRGRGPLGGGAPHVQHASGGVHRHARGGPGCGQGRSVRPGSQRLRAGIRIDKNPRHRASEEDLPHLQLLGREGAGALRLPS